MTHIEEIQNEILRKNPDLEGTLVDAASAHLTLFVLSLSEKARILSEAIKILQGNEGISVEAATRCLESSANILENFSLRRPFELTFKGIDTFNDKVHSTTHKSKKD